MANILLGVSGSIAAFKALSLTSKLSKEHNVTVIMTKNAAKFVSPLSFTALSGNKCLVDEFEIDYMAHIELAKKADIFAIVPATGNIIAKIANGIADDLLTSTILAYTKKLLIAPAMNSKMYLNEITSENLKKIKSIQRYELIEPVNGILACKDEGIGKLEDISNIYEKICLELNKKEILKNKKVLVLSGPTSEKIDEVRVITNISSGKMGRALAKAFAYNGAEVSYLSTKNDSSYIFKENIHIFESDKIYEYLKENKDKFDYIALVAAVCDIKAKDIKERKLKKYELLTENNLLNIQFEETIDLLKYISETKKEGQKIIGFAAETDNVLENARKKLDKKNCDYIILNNVKNKEIGFNSEYNEVYILSKDKEIKIDKDLKENVALKIVENICGDN